MPLDGKKIKERRKQQGLTQAAAAERAGLSQQHWAKVESGQRDDPNLSTAEKIAAALGCPLGKLLA